MCGMVQLQGRIHANLALTPSVRCSLSMFQGWLVQSGALKCAYPQNESMLAVFAKPFKPLKFFHAGRV